ncbi:MAG TPA: hypothetical protein VF189_00510 [Patescibacteria group bacterium]
MPSKLTVSKIVSTSTPLAWSQAYHAGGFTTVLSIAQREDDVVEEKKLQEIGKNLLDTLIAEYFTLVTKNLDTVKSAVEASVAKLPENIILSMVVGASVKNVLYIVIVNQGKAILKRKEKSGVLLELSNTNNTKQTECVSGYLDHNDIVILETQAFDDILPQSDLVPLIDHQHPADLAEIISPKIHEAQNGGASAIIFAYEEEEPTLMARPFDRSLDDREDRHKEFLVKEGKSEQQEEKVEEPIVEVEEKPKDEVEEEVEEQKEEIEVKEEVMKKAEKEQAESIFLPHDTIDTQIPRATNRKGASHSQKIFISIAIIIAIVLASSIFFFINKQNEAKRQQIYTSAYQPAKTKYEEGVGLIDLNKDLALSDLNQAKDMVVSAEGKLPENSSEYKSLSDLLSKITQSIQDASQANTVETVKAQDGASPLLDFAKKHTDALYISQSDKYFYAASNTSVVQYDKKTDSSKTLVKNSSDWKDIGGLSWYSNNIYLLDKTDGILKYVNGTTKQPYFSGTSPDLSKSVAMAIDWSIWVLTSDGNIQKYTRGKLDTFTMSGIDKPLSSPVSITTSADDTNLYILDKGNNRIVVFKKTGEFVTSYQTGLLKDATEFDINEKTKMAYFLSGSTVYQIEMK